jgi:hypothetical protein
MPPLSRPASQRSSATASHAVRSNSVRLNVGRLMEYSELHLAKAVHSDHPREAQLASRLRDDVSLYSSWEQSHGRLMRHVAAEGRPAAQMVELRKIAFSTLHRKAPFEYLRDRHITGAPRRLLIQRLFGSQHYGRTLVREHAAYISSACSYMCADSLCGDLLGDEAFCEALTAYESAYAEYYRGYCDSLLADSSEDVPLQSLLPYLRYQLKVIRDHLLAGAPQKSDFKQLQSLYAAGGDTQRLPVLDLNLLT